MLRIKMSIVAAFLMVGGGLARAADSYKPDDEGFLRNWLVLAPIPNGENASGTDALAKQFLADEAKASGIKTVVVSGYLFQAPASRLAQHEVLMKPMRAAELLEAVERLIGRASRP